MTSLQSLQKLKPQDFLQLLDINRKSLSHKIQPSEAVTEYKNMCKNSNIDLSEIEPAFHLLIQICKDAIKRNKPPVQLCDEVSNLGLSEEQVSLFSKQWETVHSSLVQTTALDTIAINPLVDMEWKFGVTCASSEMNSVGNVFLQLKLEVDVGNGRTKAVCFELQLSEFYSFLHEMERARASLEYLV